MKDFAELTGNAYAGQQKTQQEIRDTTRGKPVRPADYQYGKKLAEWDSSLPVGSLSRDAFIRQVEPMRDRILVQLISTKQHGSIVLTDKEPLIGGCRKAVVLKTGPGKHIAGEWWNVKVGEGEIEGFSGERVPCTVRSWEWFPSYRREMTVRPGQIVLIGNWVDLEVKDICLCQEGDVRSILN